MHISISYCAGESAIAKGQVSTLRLAWNNNKLCIHLPVTYSGAYTLW